MIVSEMKFREQKNGSLGNGAYHQAGLPEFKPQNPSGRKELTPTNGPLTSTHMS